MVVVHFVGLLRTGNPDFLAVHDNDVVTHVHMRRVLWLVLAAQTMRDLSGETTERQILGIDHQPVVLNVFCLGAICFHDPCPEGEFKGARMLLECLSPFNR